MRRRTLSNGLAWVALQLCVLVLLCRGASEQTSWLEGRRIVDIQYMPRKILHAEDLERAQALRKGQPFRAEDVAKAIDNLFASGRFEDIRVDAEPAGDGVAVRFVTQPAWFVGGVLVDGKVLQPPSRGEITGTTQISLGARFRTEDVDHAVSRVKQLLNVNGLYEAEVTPEAERDDRSQQVFLTFHLREGKRAKYQVPVIHGETKLPDDTIVRATGWRMRLVKWWKRVTEARTREGIQGILEKYQTQDRLTARAELAKLDYDHERRRVTPNLNITAGPRVKVKTVETKVSKRVLKRYVPIFQERRVDNDLLSEGARNLRDYFQSKGYYDVDVAFRIPPAENDLQNIEYVIGRGPRYKLVHVEIAGNRYFDEETLRERMYLQTASSLTLRHGRYSEAFRKKDEQNIISLYQANGFRDVKVTSVVDRSYQGKAGKVAVTVKIDEGPQWTVDKLTLNGVMQFDRNSLMAELSSAPGQPFADVGLAADRSHILTRYYARGFPAPDFRVEWQTTDTPHHVSLTYTVDEGEQQFVDKVITTGLNTTRQDLVNKQITLQPGDPLSSIEQSEIQKRFYDMGVFARVDTAIENAEGGTRYKNLLYNFEEADRYSLSLGLGAQVARFGTPSTSDLSSPGGATGFSPQFSLNASRLNFMGRGHSVSLGGHYSTLQKRASLSYFAPRFRNVEGRDITMSLLYDNSLDVRTFASRREEASVQMSQRFSRTTTGFMRMGYRRVSVSQVIIPVLLVPQLVQPVRLGIISANIAQDRRDNTGDPHGGIYNTADIGLSARYLGSQRSFARVLLRNATYHRLTRTMVLARQTQFGVIVPFSAPSGLTDQQSVPLPERFFGGGADSLRAFPFNQAGPRDTGAPLIPGSAASQPTGFPLGGNALLFNNIELRFPLLGENIQGVLFHDMGNVYSTMSDISFRFHQRDLRDFNYTVHAVGFGIRYKTPVGPIRGDLAYSINPPAYRGFSGTAEQLLQCNPNLPPSELPSFCQGSRQNVSHFQFFFSIGHTF